MITEDRLKHIMAVARLMKDNAELLELDPDEMFTLGLVHDIGYEFGESEEHHIVGYRMLEKQNYKYACEVLYHGKPTSDYASKALDLLNFADLHINKQGEYVSFAGRLDNIKMRRGENSPHYQNCKSVIDELTILYPIFREDENQR